MKTLKNIASAFALIMILFTGCKDPAEDVQIIVNTDIFKSPTLIQFVNANKAFEGPQDFTVQILGPNADLVRTTTGGKVFKASTGLLNIVLDRSANPSPTNPVKFTIVANAPGFAPVFQDVVITSPTDANLIKIPMADYANPAAGMGSLVATKAISNGTPSTDLTFTTPTNAGIAQKTDITVAAGTGFLDAAGQVITGSSLEARIVFAGTATNGTSPIVPGGNFASNLVGINGQPIAGAVYFIPAGTVTIDMFIGGKEVKSFTKPVIVDMEVNPNMINPNTNLPVKEDEVIPMWSLNDETGQWKIEGLATFGKNAAGKLVARMPINHLSSYGFFNIPGILATPKLEIGRAVAVVAEDASDSFSTIANCLTTIIVNRPDAEYAESFLISGLGVTTSQTVSLAKGEKTKTFNVLAGRNTSGQLTIEPAVNSPGKNYLTNQPFQSFVSFCGATTTFNLVAAPNPIDVNVYLRVKCGSKELQTGVNAIITITSIDKPLVDMKAYRLTNGRGSGQIIDGVTYKIVAAIDGKSYTSQFTASKTNFKLPTGFDLVGTTNYDSATNTLSIDGLVTKTDCN